MDGRGTYLPETQDPSHTGQAFMGGLAKDFIERLL